MTAILFAALMGAAQDEPAKSVQGQAIDIVFCIDCSGSMGGIIETAKQKIWTIVNAFVHEKPAPRLRIGIIGYGNGEGEHRFFALSDDLDLVYKNLMTIKDEGWGDEWVGLAIKKATEEMKWTSEKGAARIIFVAGNETAMQGREEVLYTKTAPEAIKRGIIVNTIYCGAPSADEERTWLEAAKLADGYYVKIDQSGGSVTIETPFDKRLAELTGQVNKTYVAYGAAGEAAKANQEQQDENAQNHGGAANLASRACSKNWSGYNCERWDLVDAMKDAKFKLEDLKDEQLPESMRKMTLEERKAYVEKMAGERQAIQREIDELAKKRQAHIDEEMKKSKLDTSSAFDRQITELIQKCR